MGESPGKKRKVSPVFAEKISYWRERERDVQNTHGGPTISAVRNFSKRNHGPDQSEQVVEVVTQRVSPRKKMKVPMNGLASVVVGAIWRQINIQ